MAAGIRLNEYTKNLLDKRKSEPGKNTIYESGEEKTSPPGPTSTEEIRIISEYIEQANLLRISEAIPGRKKTLILKRFFKMKRNQQVAVYANSVDEVVHILGKVSAVGRDFVMLTNLKERIWLPYHAIASANLPIGIPNYSNSHQYFIYDNDLRRKLLFNFGETVSRRDALTQQFYEESLFTNLRSWKDTWVKVRTSNETIFGKIMDSDDYTVVISFFNVTKHIAIKDIIFVYSIRFFPLVSLLGKDFFRRVRMKAAWSRSHHYPTDKNQ